MGVGRWEGSRGLYPRTPGSIPGVLSTCLCVFCLSVSVPTCACLCLSVSASVCVIIPKYKYGLSCITYLLQRSLHSTLGVLPSLQVELSVALSVASPSRSPSHYLPCKLRLPEATTADYMFDRGNPSIWRAGDATVYDTSSATLSVEAKKGTALPSY